MIDTLGKVIKQARGKRGIDQPDFARKVGVATATISLIENDRQYPEQKTLQRIATVLEIPKGVIEALALNLELDSNIDPAEKADIEQSYKKFKYMLKTRYDL